MEIKSKYNPNKDLTTLECWQKARRVKLFFYQEILPLLPTEGKYNLDIQIRKASVSAAANISEGYGRYNYKESIQFYRISRSSLYRSEEHTSELQSHSFISYAVFCLKKKKK